MLLSKKWETVWIYSLGLVVTMIIAGAIMWAQGAYNQSVGCEVLRNIDGSLPGLTTTEVESLYQGCLASATRSIHWSMPVTIIGAVGTVFLLLGYFIPVARERIRKNKVDDKLPPEITLDGDTNRKAIRKVSFSPRSGKYY